MSQGRKAPRRKHGGWLSAIKTKGRSPPTPWWQWVIGLPMLAMLILAVAAFFWVTFTQMGIHSAKVPVVSRGVEQEPARAGKAYLGVKIEGHYARLYATTEQEAARVKDGDMVEVHYTISQGAPVVVRWNPVSSPPPPGDR